ncbi:class I SAM-dependent methyltransferase [Sporolactobacillus sp. STCC-11]|uniref:class I SAM-dependent methyltransferase n=1 Tax=Sporolactobacillus caesalpiniae TaxID=3230362 RepID=UPI003397B127
MNKAQHNQELWRATVLDAWHMLEKEEISATLEGTAALNLQGCAIQNDESIQFSIQWDAVEKLHQKLNRYNAGKLEKDTRICSFSFQLNDYYVKIIGYLGTVVRTDPDRMLIFIGTDQIAVKSFSYFLHTLEKNDTIRMTVKDHLRQLQKSDTSQNGQAWNNEAYQAWVNRFGTPEQAANKIKRDPIGRIGALANYLTDVRGTNVINLLGSHAGKALALALMGARVTVVDISAENAAYAEKVAHALHIPLNYIVSDVLQLPIDQHHAKYDTVFMELGILHYFVDLEPLAELIFQMLKPGGTFVIQEFHPISTKLVTTRGKRQIVFGNYFDQTLRTRDVAYSKHLDTDKGAASNSTHTVYLREWTLGEIVTVFAQAGLMVQRLDETPNMKVNDIGLPKLFTLVCSKPE